MAEVVTIVDGVTYLLGDIAAVGDLQWSTGWPYGCLEASWSMQVKPNIYPRALKANASVEIWDGPVRVWSGFLSEPEPGTPWTLHAKGWYTALSVLLALNAAETATTSIPQDALENAIARADLPIIIGTPILATAFSSADETQQANYVLPLLDAYATSIGQRWAIDADYIFTMAADPTTSRYGLESTEALRGAADDDYVTDVYPRYVTSVDVDGNPDGWGLGHVASASSPAGRRERVMDLNDLGLLTSGLTTANDYAQGQLDLNGGRLGYTAGLEVHYGELVRNGGSPARLGLVKAGESFTAYTVADASGAVQLGLTQDVVIGRTDYADGAKTLAIQPVGLAPRTFVETLRSLKSKDSFDGTAA